MKNKLVISRCTTSGVPSPGFDDHGSKAFRIGIVFPDGRAVFGIPFVREVDAIRGAKVIRKLVGIHGTYEDVRERVKALGVKRLRQAVAEAMAW